MKTHTNEFKENIKILGRQLDSIITYKNSNNRTIILDAEDINSISPHYKGAILKSVMKQLDIDSNEEIPVGTKINYKLGIKVRDSKNYFDISKVKNREGQVINNGDSLSINTANSYEVTAQNPNKLKDYCPDCVANETYTMTAKTTGYNKWIYLRDADINWQFGTPMELTEEILNSRVYWGASGTGTTAEISNIAVYEGNGLYEYIDYGNYIVKEVEKQEDSQSYKITCYDKMLYSMVDYESLGITYPITIRNYINTICGHLGLTFANANEQFANYDKEITSEKYLSYDSKTETYTSLDYKFRDVLDELAQVTGGTICINDDDELEIRYIKDAGEITNISTSSATIESQEEGKLQNFEMEGKTTQATRSGKNLLNIPEETLVDSNTQVSTIQVVKNNQKITITGSLGELASGSRTFSILGINSGNNFTNYGNYFANAKSITLTAGTYTLSMQNIIGTFTSTYKRLFVWNSSGSTPHTKILEINLASRTSNSFTLTESTDVYFTFDYGKNSTFDNYSFNLQLEKSSTQTDYEPYGVMPSPNYPSELVSVGYQNLFDKDNVTLNTTINASGQPAYNSGSVLSDFIKVTPNTSYYLSSVRGGAYVRNCGLYDINKNFIQISVVAGGEDVSGSITTTNNTYYIRVVSGTNYYDNCQVIKGTQAHSYIPYGKYGIEVKTTRKNLIPFTNQDFTLNNVHYFVSDGNLYLNGTSTSETSSKNANFKNNFNFTLSAGTYTISHKTNIMACYLYNYDNNTLIINLATNTASQTFTLSETTKVFIGFYVYQRTFDNVNSEIMISKSGGTYEPYKSNTFLYTLNQPLRSIGNTKDLLYIKNGYLYVERKIGSVVLNGTENWQKRTDYSYANHNVFRNTDYRAGIFGTGTTGYSNYFKINASQQETDMIRLVNTNGYGTQITIEKSIASAVANLKTWLSNNNVEVNFILLEPYTEELGAVETPTIYEGITYIETTDNNQPTMNISYIEEIDEIDEEFLKDINVDFGEKFGPINTIVLSRSAESDNIYYPETLPENPVEIKISDNQIMNGNDRDQYMPEIYTMLNGLEYYANDFSSTGVCYYDLCDRYKVRIGDTAYKCVMFNDDVDITQGLEEQIYTDIPEETNTEYSKADSTDRKINGAYVLADKANSRIDEVTRQLDETNGTLNEVVTTQDATERRINIISTNIDASGNVTEVTTTTGFTFNADGMTISDSNTNFTALHRNDGTYYKDGDNIVGQYTKDGSKQKDLELFGVYSYGKNDIDDVPMFVTQLYTDNNGQECVGHFYNGGE